MDFINLLTDQSNYLPYIWALGIGAVGMTFFKLFRQILLFGGTLVFTPLYLLNQGMLDSLVFRHSLSGSDQEGLIFILSLIVGLIFGFFIPLALGKEARSLSSIGSLGLVCLVGLVMLLVSEHLNVVSLSPVQYLSCMLLLVGIVSGLCLYSFVRLLDALIPLCGWCCILVVLVSLLSPEFSTLDFITIRERVTKSLEPMNNFLDLALVGEIDDSLFEKVLETEERKNIKVSQLPNPLSNNTL